MTYEIAKFREIVPNSFTGIDERIRKGRSRGDRGTGVRYCVRPKIGLLARPPFDPGLLQPSWNC
jgi:hypothetical protein